MMIDAHRQAMAEAVVTKAAQQVPLTGSNSELKYDGSLVTYWDKAIEETVAQELNELDPGTHLVGEESHGSREDRIGWILDPIDGTANFSRGLQYFGISLAYYGEEGERAAAIWDASRRKLCTPNNVLASRSSVPLPLSFCATELDGPREYKAWGVTAFKVLSEAVHTTRVPGSVALGLAHVADGLLDLYAAPGPAIWDYAAGTILVETTSHAVVRFEDFGLSSPTLVAGLPEIVEWFISAMTARH